VLDLLVVLDGHCGGGVCWSTGPSDLQERKKRKVLAIFAIVSGLA